MRVKWASSLITAYKYFDSYLSKNLLKHQNIFLQLLLGKKCANATV
jgi:hypothetical protein